MRQVDDPDAQAGGGLIEELTVDDGFGPAVVAGRIDDAATRSRKVTRHFPTRGEIAGRFHVMGIGTNAHHRISFACGASYP
jgi:hypothetical protein